MELLKGLVAALAVPLPPPARSMGGGPAACLPVLGLSGEGTGWEKAVTAGVLRAERPARELGGHRQARHTRHHLSKGAGEATRKTRPPVGTSSQLHPFPTHTPRTAGENTWRWVAAGLL